MTRAKKRRFERALQKIYKKVPDCACKGLCTEACGPVMFSETEMNKVKDLAPYSWEEWDSGTYMPIRSEPDDLTCPFLKEDKCSIYENRPLICRVYGSAEKLQCEHGCKWTMNAEKEAQVRDDYFKLIEKENEDV